MPETQKAGTGAKAQFLLHNGTSLYKLIGVKSIKMPVPERGEVDITDLESDAAEFAPDLPDYGEMTVTLNHRDGSDTDVLLAAASTDPNARAFKIGVPIRSVLANQYTGNAILKRYELPTLENGAVQESTAVFRLTGPVTKAAWA